MAHFFLCGLILCIGFTIRAFQDGLVWPLGIDLVVIDVLLLTLIPRLVHWQARPDQAGRSVQRGHRRDLRIPAFSPLCSCEADRSPVFHSLPPH